ncbi:Rrf2 family transcriptional regulator [Clostridium tertium]|uniref:Rrf2 family transcriptional regulator n=1 Tax=Clostridium tertium TaxID=1559 RepID=A0A9X3XKG6_9CLOT|nr:MULTISPECIES: Rrf2 family transcriptional regulator [Clostridium]EEH97584.1 Rrf2 family protein [Clostridium sp. 7_2_43FAA]MBP1868517.1 Rrf2 family protein [Clostridium tertium]MBS5306367.1 Rrf2 family transcriptional regulator [Clostridium sp.]MBS6500243.1 Rrf2 family transcriptional regulator [Clostridium sp.]MBU6135084.1 Rrf2 family transcriptional regulator [Clostridium tertium]
MKISTKGRYGLRALIDLAINIDSENVSIKTISERQNISERYLEQIFSLLRKGGIIVGRKGAQGGYILGKNPSELTISEILKVLEGENIFIDINEEEENELENFINKNLWKDINCLISKYFSAITLEDLVNEYKKSKDTIIYYI